MAFLQSRRRRAACGASRKLLLLLSWNVLDDVSVDD